MVKKTLITGIEGQDCSYLAEFLIDKINFFIVNHHLDLKNAINSIQL
tara:strand:+ start:712 stop:852 length:141 start_codon:yes stop_codon:yes gene_type:complete